VCAGALQDSGMRFLPSPLVVESSAGRVKVVRGADRDGGPEKVEVFATVCASPFGVGFYPPAAPR
jgi:hypothetical protein